MVKIADQSICTGCGACAKICPSKAIEFLNDDEGFPTPSVIIKKCTECGLCNKVCPILSPIQKQPIQEAYAAQSIDSEMLMDSSSGGLFSVFSREVLKRGGIVYGCIWDKNYDAVITQAESEEELKPMRGSKYVWSWAGDTYPMVKSFLDDGRTVLFSGFPCQVAGLKAFLLKDYDNLITVDFLCSGAPSPLVFHSYLDTLSVDATPSSLNLKFRDKIPHGWGVHITYHGQRKTTAKRGDYIIDPYYYAFYSHLIVRRTCYQCFYCTDKRVSDITLGDFWGFTSYHKDLDIKKGVSALMINTKKGHNLLHLVRNDLRLIQTKKQNLAKDNNLKFDVKQRNEQIPKRRDAFFQILKTEGFRSAEKTVLHDRVWLMRRVKLFLPHSWVCFLKRCLGRT